MAITIDSTPGSTTANCYTSLAAANAYLEAHSASAEWAALDGQEKSARLIAATRELDSQIWSGRRSEQFQALAWPRLYIYDFDGFQVTGIPNKLAAATCELAVWNLLESTRLATDFELDNMESVEIGPVKYKIRAGVSSGLPSSVLDILLSIGPSIVQDPGKGTVKVMVL